MQAALAEAQAQVTDRIGETDLLRAQAEAREDEVARLRAQAEGRAADFQRLWADLEVSRGRGEEAGDALQVLVAELDSLKVGVVGCGGLGSLKVGCPVGHRHGAGLRQAAPYACDTRTRAIAACRTPLAACRPSHARARAHSHAPTHACVHTRRAGGLD